MEAKRKKIKNIILGVLAALAALAMALLPVLLRSSKTGEKDAASILNTTVQRGAIRSTISGGGALTGADALKISLPHGVEVTGYLVKNGESVEAGQPLAAVDKTTVIKTITTVQKNLEYLDTQMSSTPAARTRDTLVSPVAGRVKAVYAREGVAAAETMEENGALLVVSLDGLMAVQTETEADVPVGATVTVTLSDGTEVPGRVERRQENTLTVVLPDDAAALAESVTLTAADGTPLGEGTLYVHSAWNLMAVSGIVKNVYVKEGEKISRGYGLCYLEEMDGNGRFDQLAALRRDYEETLNRLFALYEAGAVPAPEDGIVAGIDEAKVGLMDTRGEAPRLVFLSETDGSDPATGTDPTTGTDPAPDPDPVPPPAPAAPDPNTTPPSALRNKAAVVSGVTFGSVTFLASNDYSGVSSYAAPTEPDYSQVTELTKYSFSGEKVYRFDSETGQWTESSPNILSVGQLVYLVYDTEDHPLWVLLPPQPAPAAPEEPEWEDFGGGGGAPAPFVMYDLTETEIMRLTPRGDLTVQVKIDEMDVLSVVPGQEAEITVDALPGRSFVGHVRQIDPKGENSGGRTRYTVTITVDREENMLSGMNATAILTVGVTEDVLTLPAAALAEKGGRTLAYTGYDPQSGELLLPVEVETGVSDGQIVEVLSGLTEGQQVFYSYYETAAIPELAALPGQMA